MVAVHQRQRRIEILGEAHARKLACARGFHRLMDRLIEVDRSARDRLPAREMLHLVDQSRDAVDLGTNQRRETLAPRRSEEHTSELQSLMRISYAVFCLKKKTKQTTHVNTH